MVAGLNELTIGQNEIKMGQNEVKMGQNEISIGLKNVTFRLDELEEIAASNTDHGHFKISSSNTDHGHVIYDSLVASANVKIALAGDGLAIISPDLVEAAKYLFNQKPKRPHEKELVNLYTPSLMQLVSEVNPHLRLVNSEFFQWLRCSSGHRKSDMKPDLFSAHHPLICFLPAYSNAPVCAVQRLFGKFTSWQSRVSIHCIWDAKWKIDMEAFGEKCKYLQIAGEGCVNHNKVPFQLKGVLFDVEEFWMIRCSTVCIIDVVKCKWAQSGSKQCLMDFLSVTDPWLEATNALCEALDVNIEELPVSEQAPEQCAFLGAGANGRVFRLSNGAAMKVVVGPMSDGVEKEYLMMLRCLKHDKVSNLVFPVVNLSYRHGFVGTVAYAGYLLAQEGEKISLPLTIELKAELAVSLHGLHSHDMIHGDPRIANALMLGGAVKWIDFRHSDNLSTAISRRHDVYILYESIGGVVASASEEIDAYVNNPTVDRLHTVLFK